MLALVLICCCTLANSTSSEVNWLVSIGLVGSWFFSCVISIDRKSWKLDASEVSEFVAVPDAAEEPVEPAVPVPFTRLGRQDRACAVAGGGCGDVHWRAP